MTNARSNLPSRRAFLTSVGAAAISTPLGKGADLIYTNAEDATVQDPPAASRPESAAAPIDAATLAAAARIAQLKFTDREIEQMLPSVVENQSLFNLLREQKLQNGEAPSESFHPENHTISGPAAGSLEAVFPREDPGPLPGNDTDIAFASVARLAGWLRSRQLTSARLTEIYLQRLKKYKDTLECVVTLTEELALEQAKRADARLDEIKNKNIAFTSPLLGIPYGLKDLFDTKGIRTTYGAEPWRDRVPSENASIVNKLEAAGAVLVAKLSLGALAYGDIWFGGKTKNPWNLKQGSSGSSAGSAAATAAGLVAFALGTETWGSIASPSARCGATGFRPSFGAVSRAGAMAFCWSLDKAGPIARNANDCAYILKEIAGRDRKDAGSADVSLNVYLNYKIAGSKIGYIESEYKQATEYDNNVLETFKKLGATLVPISVPRGPYAQIIHMLICVEGAAAFDDMTRDDTDDLLTWQEAAAWPNTFRATRLIPAVEYVQACRLRRRFMNIADQLFTNVDAIVAPSRHGALHALTNMTGQPAITIRHGILQNGQPACTTLWSPVYEDYKLLKIGGALEENLNIWNKRPPEFV